MTESSAKKTTAKRSVKNTSLVKTGAATTSVDRKILIVFGVILLLLVLATTWLFYVQQQTGRGSAAQGHALNSRIVDLDGQLQGLQEEISRLQEDSANMLKTQSVLTDALEVLQQQSPDSDQDWTLREVEYLVQIALHRLHLEQDSATASAALRTADSRLSELANPALIPLREQLAADINALSNINLPDITAMSAYLTDRMKRVESLPLKNTIDDVETPGVDAENTAEDNVAAEGWRAIPALIWRELKSLVVIKRKEGAGTAFIMPNEEYFLYQNLKLELANARLAVLRRDTATMQASVGLAVLWLDAYFDQKTAPVRNILESLNNMQEVELRPAMPDISGSLAAVRQFIKRT